MDCYGTFVPNVPNLSRWIRIAELPKGVFNWDDPNDLNVHNVLNAINALNDPNFINALNDINASNDPNVINAQGDCGLRPQWNINKEAPVK